jgi:glycosyltransferase involved in cell wall biosynthesis
VILMATSARDSASFAISSPASWSSKPRVVEGVDRGLPYRHVGAWISELEFQRYRPRHSLDAILKEFDIIQFVAGAAPWAELGRRIDKPKCLWVATTIRADRSSRANVGSLARQFWSAAMLKVSERYEKRALLSADSVLALSPYTSKSIEQLTGENVPLAFCGVDTEAFRPATSGDSSSSNGAPYILCVARLFDARKNVKMLLRAYAALLEQRSDVPELRLVGEPLSSEALKLLGGLGIAGRVQCYGPTHGEQLARLYRNASFFVLPSDEEGLGIVILEAMASGIAVISTASGGPNVAVDDGTTGFLTPVGDEQALTRAMARLLDDPALAKRFGEAGRRKAEDVFSLDASSDVFFRQYEKMRNLQLPDAAGLRA